MEVDLLYQESIVMSSNTGLFRLDLSEHVVYPMVDAHGRNMINISWYPSFAQMDNYKILLVDGSKHCLKLFGRVLNEEPVTLVGLCGHRGYSDGLIQTAQFNFPVTLVKDPSKKTFYLTENFYIRRITFDDIDLVSTELRHDNHVILGLAINFEQHIGFYTTHNRLQKFNLLNSRHSIEAVSMGEEIGHLDGKLNEAKFDNPQKIALLDARTIIVAEPNNKCLRVIDLNAGNASSVCNRRERPSGTYTTGNIRSCQLVAPQSLVYTKNQSTVLIGDYGKIMALNFETGRLSRLSSDIKRPTCEAML